MSAPGKIPVLNAADDPAHFKLMEEMIGRMRAAIAPMLNEALADEDDERFGLLQGMMTSAGAIMAGMTVGHMIALGKLSPQDRARATKVVTVAFRTGIKLGETEAREAMLSAASVEGHA